MTHPAPGFIEQADFQEEADFVEALFRTAPGANNYCRKRAECYHPTCRYCNKLIRVGGTHLIDHPGTVTGLMRKRICLQCDAQIEAEPFVNCRWCGTWTDHELRLCTHCQTTGYPRIK